MKRNATNQEENHGTHVDCDSDGGGDHAPDGPVQGDPTTANVLCAVTIGRGERLVDESVEGIRLAINGLR
jgi:hypothetical protein